MSVRDGDGDEGRIVELTRFRGRNVRPVLAQVEACWEDARRGRLVPCRSDISPQALQGALAHVFVIERISTGLARFRIAGAHLGDLIGTDARGMPVSAIFETTSRDGLSDAMQAVFDDPSIVRFELSCARGFGRSELTGDMLLMPLRSDLGEISRALGAVVMTGEIGRTPRKLQITGQTRRGLVGFAGPEGAPLKVTTPPRRAPKLEEPELPRIPKKEGAKSSHLRLVADNSCAD